MNKITITNPNITSVSINIDMLNNKNSTAVIFSKNEENEEIVDTISLQGTLIVNNYIISNKLGGNKITDADTRINTIIAMREKGVVQNKIATALNISQATVSLLLKEARLLGKIK